MELKRRAFLGALASAAAGLAFDPERLLWVPGAKVYSLPPVQIFQPRSDLGAIVAALWNQQVEIMGRDFAGSSHRAFDKLTEKDWNAARAVAAGRA